MGYLLGSRRVGARPVLAGLIAAPILLTLVSCGGGDDSGNNPFTNANEEAADTTETTALPACSEARHLAVFDIIGLLTLDGYEGITRWSEEGIYPEARAGTPETVQAFRERGFEILYLTTLPTASDLNGVPALDAMTAWLTEKGYPMDAGVTGVWTLDGTAGGTPMSNISNELLRLSGEGVSIDVGVTENADKAYGFAIGGVPTEGLFTLESMPVEGRREQDTPDYPVGPPTTPVAGDDFVAFAAQIAQLPPVCQP
jgi:hypothetical protein